MPAPEIAQVPGVHLQGVYAVPNEGTPMTYEDVGEWLDPCRLPEGS